MQQLWKDFEEQAEDYGSPRVPPWPLSSLPSVGKHFSDILIGIISNFLICIFGTFKFYSANTFLLEERLDSIARPPILESKLQ